MLTSYAATMPETTPALPSTPPPARPKSLQMCHLHDFELELGRSARHAVFFRRVASIRSGQLSNDVRGRLKLRVRNARERIVFSNRADPTF